MTKKTPMLRLILITIGNLFALAFLIQIIPGFYIKNWIYALVFILVVSLINAFIRPFIIKITLSATIYTLGLFSLLVNAVLLYGASVLLKEGVYIDSLWVSFWVGTGLSIFSTALSSLFAIDDADVFYRNMIKKVANNTSAKSTKKPGIIFIEIDGLSLPVLQRALQNAYLPTVSRWVRETHSVKGWENDTASSTPACQAGILLGNNHNMPAFRWFDRAKQKTVTLGDFRDTLEVEKEQDKKDGLLKKNGMSINNMFSGGADNFVLTASKILDKKKNKDRHPLYYFFLSPYAYIRIIYLSFIDALHELNDSYYQKRREVIPRVHRGLKYVVMRLATSVIMRDISVSTIIGAVYEGRSSIYATFVGYDEVAHFAGNERSQAMFMLQQLDKQFKKIEAALVDAPRPYHIVLLSDHGHSQGATFLQRYGYTLGDLVRREISKNDESSNDLSSSNAFEYTDEGWSHLNALLSDVAQDDSVQGKVVSSLTKKHQSDGVIEYKKEELSQIVSEVEVYASGNLGLVYFRHNKKRLTYEEINKKYPTLLSTLADHDGIGFIMVRSKKRGGLVIGAEGTYHLTTNKIYGKNPLRDFGSNAARHLARTDSFKNAPDILVNSMYDPGTDEVAGFEEMVSVHGGMGGNQNKPFVLFPKELEFPTKPVVGAEALHRVFKKWVKST